jgi:purine-binding chemotaxis protein CheW
MRTINKDSATLSSEETLQLVSFRLGHEEFGMDILKVREIIRMQRVTRVPHAAEFVEGIINLRGSVIPVIGLRQRIGLEPRQADNDTRTVVAEVGGIVVGFVVDSVSTVLRIPTATVEAPPRMSACGGKSDERAYISGIGKLEDRLLLVFDADRLLNDSERAACEAVIAA